MGKILPAAASMVFCYTDCFMLTTLLMLSSHKSRLFELTELSTSAIRFLEGEILAKAASEAFCYTLCFMLTMFLMFRQRKSRVV